MAALAADHEKLVRSLQARMEKLAMTPRDASEIIGIETAKLNAWMLGKLSALEGTHADDKVRTLLARPLFTSF